MATPTWGCAPITKEEVRAAVSAGHFEERPWDLCKDQPDLLGDRGRDFHIRRIAYFVANGLPDDQAIVALLARKPGISSIHHGNHRVAAAHLSGKSMIEVIACNSESELNDLFDHAWERC